MHTCAGIELQHCIEICQLPIEKWTPSILVVENWYWHAMPHVPAKFLWAWTFIICEQDSLQRNMD